MVLLSSCAQTQTVDPVASLPDAQNITSSQEGEIAEEPKEVPAAVRNITSSQAREFMEDGEPFILIDVRNQNEFDQGRIYGAILLPAEQIRALAPDLLPDTEARILLYCRSGARSSGAARTLIDMGYLNVYDFGGIISWPYEVIR